MIESCPKKRMIVGISVLGILTVLVLIVESHWTESNKHLKKQNFVVEQNSTCWEKEKYEVIKDCEPCSAFELRSKSIGVCIHTHFKEVLRCANGETVTRSCDRAAYFNEQAFWRFEGFVCWKCRFIGVCCCKEESFRKTHTSESSKATGELRLRSAIYTLEFKMKYLFINAYQESDTSFSINIETMIIINVYKLANTKEVQLLVNLLREKSNEPLVTGDFRNINYKTATDIPELTANCVWPVIVMGQNIIAGLCSVSRELIKQSNDKDIRKLLGFRQASLMSCSENSIWTKFCEVDIIDTTKETDTQLWR
ncbi:hypothetical protein NQ317_004566 [Molorchus minor]|uniref:Uncharacterized protein n=1 Tax=Molorchus minor TaxID=1323400 RepID=A0ABQ9JZZ3_9CUCU|nr:hypothetical protein NQ317_004566 [Molorchus minor]